MEVLHGMALCAGGGGLELGLRLALGPRYRCVVLVEREAYASATLVARMEDETLDLAPVWDDVATFDGRRWRGAVDILSAGYPCPPFSVAGKKLGKKDERYIWPDIARVIRESEPAIVWLENVPNHLRIGFQDVYDELRALGYDVEAGLFSAEEVGAPHARERLFVLGVDRRRLSELANPDGEGQGRRSAPHDGRVEPPGDVPDGRDEELADTDRARGEGRGGSSGGSTAGGGSGGGCGEMADAGVAGLQGGEQPEARHRDGDRPEAHGSAAELRRPFPPGPSDLEGWRLVLADRPDLAPAVRPRSSKSRQDPERRSGGTKPAAAPTPRPAGAARHEKERRRRHALHGAALQEDRGERRRKPVGGQEWRAPEILLEALAGEMQG